MTITGKEKRQGPLFRIDGVVLNEELVKMSRVSAQKARQLFIVAATARLHDAGQLAASVTFNFRPA